MIERSEQLDLGGLRVAVPRKSDLILLKLAAGGILDLQDVVALLAIGTREETIAAVEERVHDLDAVAQQAWERVKHQSADRA